jgi:phosphoglycolate phosphatase
MSEGRARSVLFDLDGTLTDPADGIEGCIRHALESLGAPVYSASRLTRCIGPPLRESFAMLLDHPGEAVVEEAVRRYRKRFEARGMYENRVYPGIPELLGEIGRMGWSAYVVTSKPRIYARKILDHFELGRFFVRVHGSEMDGRLTRKGELLAHVLVAESLVAGDAVMVGDRAEDILGAQANGIASIGVTYGYGSLEELRAAGATRICEDPASVLAALQEHYREER